MADGKGIDIETTKILFNDEQGNVIGISRDRTDKKELERQLREQMDYAELLFRTVPSAVLSIDKRGKIIRWNKIAEEITGYDAAEVLGKECSRVLHGVGKDDCGLCREAIDAPLINVKCKIITKEGQIRHVLKSIAILKDEFGEISEKMECFGDITELITMEAELRESKEKYSAIVNNAPQLVVIHKEGIIKFVNDVGRETLGYKEEYIGRHIRGFITKNSLVRVNTAVRERILGKDSGPYEIELVKKSGKIINVLLKGTVITYNSEKATLAVMLDITDSKQLNARLRASEEKFRQFAETINEIFLITDVEKIVYVSPAFERIIGMPCQTLLDNPHALVELIHSSDREKMRDCFPQSLLNMNQATNEEFKIIRPDGEIRWLWLQSYPMRGKANNSSLKATSIVDITDRKKVEEKLRERERQTQRELSLAARVQQDSLPQPFSGDMVRVGTIFEPYSKVSGDFFNYKWFEKEKKLCGYIIDVSGHGVATALQTATFKMMLDNVLLTGGSIEEDALQIINRKIMPYLYEDSFVALLYFEFDFIAGELKLISAGITLFLVAKPHECSLVSITGCYLGIIDNPAIDKVTIPLKAGEIYCMMSDGVSDLLEVHGICKQESFTEYENWLEKLAKSPDRNDDFSVICIEVLLGSGEMNVLDIKTKGERERAQLTLSEFLQKNAPSYASILEVAINEAMNNGLNSGGRVRVKTKRVGSKLIIRVKDDGPGFDTKRVKVQLKEDMYEKEFDELLEAEGGRGILLMRLFCDKVIYNAKGNEVLLMKKIQQA
ncbi:MAG: PAS domain S-box protein [Desulfosporosinus sp.]|nr:PAS domain S-box protein [Desulfosporosinus sp.]